MTSPTRHRRLALRTKLSAAVVIGLLTVSLDTPGVAEAGGPLLEYVASNTATAFVAPAASASVRLSDGRYLVIGCAPGHCPSVLTAAEILNPATGQAVPTGPTLTPHGYATLTLLASGEALLAGGCSARLCGKQNPHAEIWNPTTGAWTATGSMLGDPDYGNIPQHASAVRVASGEVLVAGGTNYAAETQLWNATTGHWRATSPMREPRESFTPNTLRPA